MPSDSWGVDVVPDYVVSSSALILLAPPKPGLHFHSVIPVGQQGGHTAAMRCCGTTERGGAGEALTICLFPE